MARRVDVRLNLAGINELMTSDEVQGLVDEAGQEIATTAGPGYEYVPLGRGSRAGARYVARGYVQTTDLDSIIHNVRTNSLLRAVYGKGGLREYTSREGNTSWITQKQYDNYTRRRRS